MIIIKVILDSSNSSLTIKHHNIEITKNLCTNPIGCIKKKSNLIVCTSEWTRQIFLPLDTNLYHSLTRERSEVVHPPLATKSHLRDTMLINKLILVIPYNPSSNTSHYKTELKQQPELVDPPTINKTIIRNTHSRWEKTFPNFFCSNTLKESINSVTTENKHNNWPNLLFSPLLN